MSKLSLPTLKVLFAKSRNQCAFPECDVPLVEATDTVTGEICHIRSEKVRGPRYDKGFPAECRNAAENLILMCGRHHKIIDTETKTYTTEELLRIKKIHEESGVVEISPQIAKHAQALLNYHESFNITNNAGQIAINSPGAIVAGVVNLKGNRTKVVTSAPVGAIGASQPMSAYCKYLIEQYNKYQKADFTEKSNYKFMALPIAVKRKFGNRWQDLPETDFDAVVAFLQSRIDETIIGRNNRKKATRNYHLFPEHGV